MSTTTTITKPAPILEGSLTAFLKSIDKLGAGAVPSTFTGIDTSKFAPKVADQVALQTDAAKAAADLGTLVGPDAFKQFMSPYQQEVIDTTLAEFDRQQAIADTALRDRAIAAGAFGGGREGVIENGVAFNTATLQKHNYIFPINAKECRLQRGVRTNRTVACQSSRRWQDIL